jgi:drug/metabolite transporter (DMT)-like permease
MRQSAWAAVLKLRPPTPGHHILFELTSLLLGLLSALLIGRGSFFLNDVLIAQLAGTYWGYNSHLVKALSSQAGEGRVGLTLLVVSIILQGLTLRQRHEPPLRQRAISAWVCSIIIAIVVGAGGVYYADSISQGIEDRAIAIVKARSRG